MEREIAIIGTTASGKSDLAIEIAKKYNGIILSLDSLSIYKEIDIASAKPTKEQLKEILHFGVNIIYPNEPFSVISFIEEYKRAKEKAIRDNKILIIAGGSTFYLKAMLDGLSPMPKISPAISKEVEKLIKTKRAFLYLKKIDPIYANKITHNDKYRIQKALEIYFSTNLTPTIYFKANPPKPTIKNIPIYEIITPKEILKNRIYKRTLKMIKNGLIDEVAYLEKKYGASSHPLGAIGIKEVLEYFNGKVKYDQLLPLISQNTLKLAKRQRTFNKTQLPSHYQGSLLELKRELSLK